MEEQGKYPPHPAANCFPMMQGKAYERLRDDIAAHGLLFPVILCSDDGQWKILDGRNRAKACDELGIKYKTEIYDGRTPIKYVISANMARRDLTDWERHEAANALAKLQAGSNQHKAKARGPAESAEPHTQAEVAKEMDLSVRGMQQQKYAEQHALPEVVEAARAGEITVNAAHDIAHLPAEKQPEALEAKRRGERAAPVFDPHITKACAISDEDIAGIAALVRFGSGSPNHDVRHGAEVIKRIVPAVRQ